jgi:WD40 repeat protein
MNIRYLPFKIICLAMIVLTHSIAAMQQPYVFLYEWSDDGSHLAVVTRTELIIFDESHHPIGREVFPTEIGFELPYINLNADGTRIYVGNATEKRILDTANLQPISDFSDEWITYWSSQWNSDGSEIAFRARDGRSTVIYDAATGHLLRTFSTGLWRAGYLNGSPVLSPDDRFFAGVIGDGTVVIFNATTGEEVTRYGIQNEEILDLAWSPDPTNLRLALVTYAEVAPGSPDSFPESAGDDNIRNSVFFVDALSGATISSVTGLRDGISRSAWHPNGIEFSGNDGYRRLYTWNSDTGELIDSYLTEPY